MNVLLLMAGGSQAFKDAGHLYPKNLVEIAGEPLVQRVLVPLRTLREPGGRFIAMLHRDENRKHHTGQVLELIEPGILVEELPGSTTGAACTALLAIEHIDNDAPLLIFNGDQILERVDLAEVVGDFRRRGLDAGVVVFRDVHPRWSFVRCSEEGSVVETAEKRPISNLATAGCYYFARGADFVKAAMAMIMKEAQVDGRFYVCPALNELVLGGARIGIHEISRQQYRSLATPADVAAYAARLTSEQSPHGTSSSV